MFDRNKMYAQVPEEVKVEGLVKVLTDINGNEFNADNYDNGFEIMIDYPSENGSDLRVIDYAVCSDSGNKYWKELRKRQWVSDGKNSSFGRWVEC